MQLAFLAPLYERPGPWAGVHLDTAWTDESPPSRRELQVREACRELAVQGADEATGRAVYEALTTRPHYPGESGRAVFATGGEVGLDPPLAHRPPGASDVSWSAHPCVAPLLDLAVQEPVCLVAYIDRTGADLEPRSPLGSRAVGQAQGKQWPIHRTATSTHWSASHHQQSVGHLGNLGYPGPQRRRDRAGDRSEPGGLRCRPGRSGGGPAVPPGPSEPARRGGAGSLPGRPRRDSRGPTGPGRRGTRGPDRQLFIRPEGADAHHEVWVGSEPEQLAVRRTDLQYLGEPQPSSARADDALLRCAAVSGAEALRVPPQGHDDVPVGGLGALLRRPYDDDKERGVRPQ